MKGEEFLVFKKCPHGGQEAICSSMSLSVSGSGTSSEVLPRHWIHS